MRRVAEYQRFVRLRPVRLLSWLLPLALAGCGFHLQGSGPLPRSLASVHIEAIDTQSEFYVDLRRALRSAGVRLDDAGQDTGAAVVHILTDQVKDTVLTVSTLNAPTAFELVYTVRVSVDAGGRERIAPEVHALSRDYTFDERELLAKERESAILSAALARELVTVIMRRLASL
jgi:LPS-assembly lipoprotein